MAKIGKCLLCGEYGKIHRHHISYFEDRAIEVCPHCHKHIHKGILILHPPDDYKGNVVNTHLGRCATVKEYYPIDNKEEVKAFETFRRLPWLK